MVVMVLVMAVVIPMVVVIPMIVVVMVMVMAVVIPMVIGAKADAGNGYDGLAVAVWAQTPLPSAASTAAHTSTLALFIGAKLYQPFTRVLWSCF